MYLQIFTFCSDITRFHTRRQTKSLVGQIVLDESNVKTGQTNFQTNKSSKFVRLFVRLGRRFFIDDLFFQTNKSNKLRSKFTLDKQIVRRFV